MANVEYKPMFLIYVSSEEANELLKFLMDYNYPKTLNSLFHKLLDVIEDNV